MGGTLLNRRAQLMPGVSYRKVPIKVLRLRLEEQFVNVARMAGRIVKLEQALKRAKAKAALRRCAECKKEVSHAP